MQLAEQQRAPKLARHRLSAATAFFKSTAFFKVLLSRPILPKAAYGSCLILIMKQRFSSIAKL